MNHSFDINNAKKYGVTEAIILENFKFWIAKNKANNKHFHDGRYWTYNSARAMTELFPYLNERAIRYAIEKLIAAGVLVKGNYNAVAYDRTSWYAFGNEDEILGEFCISNDEKEEIHLPKIVNETTKIGEPIPDINTDRNKDINRATVKDKSFPVTAKPKGFSKESHIIISGIISYYKSRNIILDAKDRIYIGQALKKLDWNAELYKMGFEALARDKFWGKIINSPAQYHKHLNDAIKLIGWTPREPENHADEYRVCENPVNLDDYLKPVSEAGND